jgi:hypothetical protein
MAGESGVKSGKAGTSGKSGEKSGKAGMAAESGEKLGKVGKSEEVGMVDGSGIMHKSGGNSGKGGTDKADITGESGNARSWECFRVAITCECGRRLVFVGWEISIAGCSDHPILLRRE